FQFFSAPILGKLSDRYGRRPLLILSQISTFVSFLILAFSNSVGMIFLSRAVDGILGSNFTIAQAYISDISSKKDRSKAFGISGMAFGIGFLIGPAVGGYLSQFGYSIPALVVAGISFLTILGTWAYLPETVKKRAGNLSKIKINYLPAFGKYLSGGKTTRYLIEFFTFMLTHVIWTSNFALYSERKFGFGAQNVGFLLAYVGLINIALRGFLIPKLIDRYGEFQLKIAGVVSIIIGLLLLSVANGYLTLLPAISLFAFGGGISRPLLMGSISRSASEREQGAVIGFTNSLGSIAQMIGPLIGGYLLTNFFPDSLMLVSAFVMGIGFLLILKGGNRAEDQLTG
ncbi:MFS transporter, partial [Patescibacteria group bacterium]|nr:MFS transporter [Patescibacteria group bacterium]